MESEFPFFSSFLLLKKMFYFFFFPSEFFFFFWLFCFPCSSLFSPIQVTSISKIFKKSSAFVWGGAHFIHSFINH